MSLIGLDVGTSSIKAAAFRQNGAFLAVGRAPLTPQHLQAGWETLDPQDSWRAACRALAQLSAHPEVRRDPPTALAISASGDEVFPVGPHGTPLDVCLLSADGRGAEIEAQTQARLSAEMWVRRCGHVPERMDPINRILWWRAQRPAVFAAAARFLGWHEFLTLRLCGRAAVDPSLASKWLTYDLPSGGWSPEMLTAFALDPALLPEIAPWGVPLGSLLPEVAAETGLPPSLQVYPGGFDSICAALGAGAAAPQPVGLACGSWQVLVAPLASLPEPGRLAATGLSISPYPGSARFALLSQNPNGTAVLDWLSRLTARSIADLERDLPQGASGPAAVLAVPHFSGALSPWPEAGRAARGAFLGLTLAASPVELFQSLLESEAYDLALTLESLARLGVAPRSLRASGGGSRSSWWMQLTADLTGLQVEAAHDSEVGARGAAILAGLPSTPPELRPYQPNPERALGYGERIRLYRAAVAACLPIQRGLA